MSTPSTPPTELGSSSTSPLVAGNSSMSPPVLRNSSTAPPANESSPAQGSASPVMNAPAEGSSSPPPPVTASSSTATPDEPNPFAAGSSPNDFKVYAIGSGVGCLVLLLLWLWRRRRAKRHHEKVRYPGSGCDEFEDDIVTYDEEHLPDKGAMVFEERFLKRTTGKSKIFPGKDVEKFSLDARFTGAIVAPPPVVEIPVSGDLEDLSEVEF